MSLAGDGGPTSSTSSTPRLGYNQNIYMHASTLRATRRARGLTQDRLAAGTNISQSRLSLAERGKIFLRDDEITALTRVLGVARRALRAP